MISTALIPGVGVFTLELTLLSFFNILNLLSIILVVALNLLFSINIRNIFILAKYRFKFSNIFALLIWTPILFIQFSLLYKIDNNPDVAVFHYPLLESLTRNQGFKFPQIDHPFYGNIPLGNHILSASTYWITDGPLSLHVNNLVIFYICIFLISTLVKINPYIKSFSLITIFFTQNYFLPAASDGMQEIIRASFVMSFFVFFYHFISTRNSYFLIPSGIAIGLAISTKMSELILLPISFVLLGVIHIRFKVGSKWNKNILLLYFPVLIFGSYPYLRNLFLTGNPFFPFLFQHPGLSDEWMAIYMKDLSRPFEPSDRLFLRDPLKIQGWIDGVGAFSKYFFDSPVLKIIIVLAIVSFSVNSITKLFLLLNMSMYIFWYFFMFNHVRWAIPAFMLTCSLAYVALTSLIERMKSFIFNSTNRLFYIIVLSVPFLIVSTSFLKESFYYVKSNLEQFKKYEVAFLGGDLDSFFRSNISQFEILEFVRDNQIDKIYYSDLTSPNEFFHLYFKVQDSPFISFETLDLQSDKFKKRFLVGGSQHKIYLVTKQKSEPFLIKKMFSNGFVLYEI